MSLPLWVKDHLPKDLKLESEPEGIPSGVAAARLFAALGQINVGLSRDEVIQAARFFVANSPTLRKVVEGSIRALMKIID